MNPVAEKSDNQEPVRVVEIGVKGLFGLYDHTVKLKDERVTIIHGPNGVGKTVFLKLVHDFVQGDFKSVVGVRFDTLYLQLEEGALLTVTQIHADTEILYSLSVKTAQVEWSVDSERGLQTSLETLQAVFEKQLIEYIFKLKGSDSRESSFLDNPIKYPRLFSSGQWLDMWSELIRVTSSMGHYVELNSVLMGVNRLNFAAPNAPLNTPAFTPRIEEYAKQLVVYLNDAIGEYGQKSSQLEQTFPDRLIDSSDVMPDVDSLKQAFTDINQQRVRYELIGLLEESADAERFNTERLVANLSPVKLVAMALHAQDAKAKLDVLEPLAQRVERFLALMNSKLKNKSLRMERPEGVVVRDRRGVSIPLASLSTGEQHLFVLLYDLIFTVKPNQLVLIDEPEAGMHISWQRRFIDDLLSIIKFNSFDVVLATHSPDLIEAHHRLMVEFSAKPDSIV